MRIKCDNCNDEKHYYYGQRVFCADCEDDIGFIKKLEAQNKIMKDALEFYDGALRLNWAIDLNKLKTTAIEALIKCKKLENE